MMILWSKVPVLSFYSQIQRDGQEVSDVKLQNPAPMILVTSASKLTSPGFSPDPFVKLFLIEV